MTSILCRSIGHPIPNVSKCSFRYKILNSHLLINIVVEELIVFSYLGITSPGNTVVQIAVHKCFLKIDLKKDFCGLMVITTDSDSASEEWTPSGPTFLNLHMAREVVD